MNLLGGGVHGSGLMTQGQAQCLAVATVGRDMEERRNEGALGRITDRVIVHYNSPASSTFLVCLLLLVVYPARLWRLVLLLQIRHSCCLLNTSLSVLAGRC